MLGVFFCTNFNIFNISRERENRELQKKAIKIIVAVKAAREE